MADVSDVAKSLQAQVQAIRDASFPTGTVLYGWPGSAEFAAASRAPLVTVWQRPGFSRLTTRYPRTEWQFVPAVPPSFTASVSGSVATFAGTCSTDQIAGVQVGTTAWAMRCAATDTPSTVAASLAALSGGTAAGPALTLPGILAARTGRDVVFQRVTRQQEVQFAVIVWTSDPDARDSIASTIDSALSGIDFLTFADGSSGQLKWAGTLPSDRAQNSDLYSRQLIYSVDYSTTQRVTRTPVLFPLLTMTPLFGAQVTATPSPAYTPTPPTTAGVAAGPRIVTSSAAAAIGPTDGLVCFNRTTSPTATTVTLEAAPTRGTTHVIKDMAGNAATYPITIAAALGGTIDGQASAVLNVNYGAIAVQFNGTEWSIE